MTLRAVPTTPPRPPQAAGGLPLPRRLPATPASPLIEVGDPFLAQVLGAASFPRRQRRLLTRYVQWAVWERKGWLLGQITATELAELWPDLTLSTSEADVLAPLLAKDR